MDTARAAPKSRRPGAWQIAAASVVGILALLLIAVGVTSLWVRSTSDGSYVSSGAHRYESSGRAIVTDAADVRDLPDWLVARVRVKASSDKPLFVGVGRRADVDRHLAGVAHSTVEDVNFGPFDVEYSAQPGSARPLRPATQTFWSASSAVARRRDERRRLGRRRDRRQGRRPDPRRVRPHARRARARRRVRRPETGKLAAWKNDSTPPRRAWATTRL